MISSFTIGNFKAFGPKQKIPIKPITLIFGANSAGKSSILHSLLFANEAKQTGNLDVFQTRLGGESVDLGGFRQFTHQSRSENQVVLSFDIPRLEPKSSKTWDLETVAVITTYGIRAVRDPIDVVHAQERFSRVFDIVGKTKTSFEEDVQYRNMMEEAAAIAADAGDAPPEMLSYEIAVNDATLLRASRKGGAVKVDYLGFDNPALRNYLKNLLLGVTLETQVTGASESLAFAVINRLAEDLELQMGGLLPRTVAQEQRASTAETPILNPKSASAETEEQLALFFRFNFGKLVESVHEEVGCFLDRLKYLGPLRSNPPRHIAFAEDTSQLPGAEGAFAWSAVRNNDEIRSKVNAWLGKDFLQTQYELAIDTLISSGLTAEELETELEQLLSEKYIEWDEARSRMGEEGADEFFFNPYDAWNSELVVKRLLRQIITRTAAGAVRELILRDKRNKTYVSHRDIGIGISQVLPVLVHAFGSNDQIIAIEQPEIHLHPALQSELADVFVESALGKQKNTFLIETHSEHLILRVLRRIRETHLGKLPAGCERITPDDVAILFVQPTAQASEVKQLRVDEQGRLIDPWPGGFFEEAFSELF